MEYLVLMVRQRQNGLVNNEIKTEGDGGEGGGAQSSSSARRNFSRSRRAGALRSARDHQRSGQLDGAVETVREIACRRIDKLEEVRRSGVRTEKQPI